MHNNKRPKIWGTGGIVMIYSKFSCTYLLNKTWITENRYYCGDHSNFDPSDWRFCEVVGVRKQLKFIELVECK